MILVGQPLTSMLQPQQFNNDLNQRVTSTASIRPQNSYDTYYVQQYGANNTDGVIDPNQPRVGIQEELRNVSEI